VADDDQVDVDVQLVPYCGDRRPGLPSLLCSLPPGHEGMHAATYDDAPGKGTHRYGTGRYEWAPASMVAANSGRGTDRHPGAGRPVVERYPGPPLATLLALDDDDVDGVLPALVELTDDQLRDAFSELTHAQRLKLARLLLDVGADQLRDEVQGD
jgi:hypothetical protein